MSFQVYRGKLMYLTGKCTVVFITIQMLYLMFHSSFGGLFKCIRMNHVLSSSVKPPLRFNFMAVVIL